MNTNKYNIQNTQLKIFTTYKMMHLRFIIHHLRFIIQQVWLIKKDARRLQSPNVLFIYLYKIKI